MGRVIGAMLLTMFLSLADTALADAAGGDDSVGPKACGALQQETVPQSLRSAEFIVEHIEFIPPQEQAYMEKESSAANLGPDIGSRYEFVTRRPSYPAWRLQISLRDLIKALKSIDEMSPGENADAHRAKHAAFALVSLAQTRVAFAEYARVDRTRTRPVLDDATRRVASVSLSKMAQALAWFVGCNVDVLESQKK
jgi:hypothetical protein